MKKNKGFFTTGDVARLIGVSPKLVGTWADRGMIKHYKCPGTGGHRRFTKQALQRFLREQKLPMTVPEGIA